jgi:hypothetical protein
MRVDGGAQPLDGGQLGVGLGQATQVERGRADGLYVELLLAAKVMIEKALGDAGGGGHVVD